MTQHDGTDIMSPSRRPARSKKLLLALLLVLALVVLGARRLMPSSAAAGRDGGYEAQVDARAHAALHAPGVVCGADHGHSAAAAHPGDAAVAAPADAHGDAAVAAPADAHGDGDHGDHDDHDDHGEGRDVSDGHAEGQLTMSEEERRHAGIRLAVAESGTLSEEKAFRGEIAVNRERQTHLSVPVAGVIDDILVSEGDLVEAGQVLAVLRSSELAEMRLDYLGKLNQAAISDWHARRADAVHANTLRLLDFLAAKPSLAELGGFAETELGERLAQLVDAYGELELRRRQHEREERLRQQNITSEEDYLEAKAAYEKASAHYRALRDSAAYEERLAWENARVDAREKRLAAEYAALRLRLAGTHDIDDIRALAAGVENGTTLPADVDWARCEIRATLKGTVLRRTHGYGERIEADAELLVLADTSAVWVEVMVYEPDLLKITKGQDILVRAVHGRGEALAQVLVIPSRLDPSTRAAVVRAVLDNPAGDWRPGQVIEALVRTASSEHQVVVPREAVQSIDQEQVVFVPSGDAFRLVPVELGFGDRERVSIRRGLGAGTRYVSAGAYALKAKLVTSALDPHAGHGH